MASPAPTATPAAVAAVDVDIRGVSHRFPGSPALAGIDLHVAGGEFVTLLGPSGCGKTTLLRIVAGLLTPSEGEVSVGGGAPAVARRAKQFGFVPQSPALLPWRSVLDNVLLPFQVNKQGPPRRDEAIALLASLGLGGYLDARPHQLSGGMQQRVAVARAFAFGPPVLLMDEPFAALDEITRTSLRHALEDLWRERRKTVLFVTHSLAEAVMLSDRVVVLSNRPGHIVGIHPVDLPRPRTEDVEDSPLFVDHVQRLRALLRSGW